MRLLLMILALTAATTQARASAPVPASAAASANYQACLAADEARLTFEDERQTRFFRMRLKQLNSAGNGATYATGIAKLIDETVEVLAANPKVGLRHLGALNEERLRQVVRDTIGTDARTYRWFQRTLDLLDRGTTLKDEVYFSAWNALREELEAHFAKQPSPNGDAKAHTETRRAQTLALLAQVYEGALTLQPANEARHRKSVAVVRQVTMGAVGVVALVAAFKIAGPALAAGGTLSQAAVGSKLAGELAGVAVVGGVGGGAVQAIESSAHSLLEAWVQSGKYNTPFACEVLKLVEHSESEDIKRIAAGVLVGGTTGLGAAGLAKFLPRLTLWIVGGAVAGSTAYELGSSLEEGYKAYRYYRMAEEATTAGDIELAVELLNEARGHARDSGMHAVDGAIVGSLAYAFFGTGEFKHALKTGSTAIFEALAKASDEIPAAANSASKAGVATLDLLQGKIVTTKFAKLNAKLASAKLKAAKAGSVVFFPPLSSPEAKQSPN